MSFEGA